MSRLSLLCLLVVVVLMVSLQGADAWFRRRFGFGGFGFPFYGGFGWGFPYGGFGFGYPFFGGWGGFGLGFYGK
ncbi:hypothetical protein RvY_11675 [Ramazzottius varieornatus]|uniref:Sulfur globule protein CV3 n=1 Tax=Ramazzottius varieornatus TaxID=947166 RepID=A0A1D1VGV6_RAMVA|nr:hypothetical protein RvY_11675 [Ramazzottius varieornatus]